MHRSPPPEIEPRCPTCGRELARVAGPHGLVQVCVDCRGGATTLSVLRKVAPREFVNHVWQAAWKHGVPSARRCPSCARPLVETSAEGVHIEPRVDVCFRCYMVWLDAASLAPVPVATPGAPADATMPLAIAEGVIQALARGGPGGGTPANERTRG